MDSKRFITGASREVLNANFVGQHKAENNIVVGRKGFEPSAFRLSVERSSKLS
jgi:hypothetical protein